MPELFKVGAQEAVGSVFTLYAEFVVAASYMRSGGVLATVHVLVMPVPPDVVDGTTVLPNDERVLLDAQELTAVDQPRPGDYLVQTSNSLRRDVVTAHLDVTGTLWTLATRRVF
jgi:hypothetical protein